ncbi:hypothetical protein [Pseudofrankia sp. DC12]|uniref:hypothetical protein n=1 Tax=Pseudofrankia sp. DC12 TaxID=683315 RepID=UPI0005F84A50|nr:hypothetical protein [Pseudofrankia sp. DC12]
MGFKPAGGSAKRSTSTFKAVAAKGATAEGEAGLTKRFVEGVLGRIGPTSSRAVVLIGVQPASALTHAYPEFNAALVFLDLRARIAHALPSVDPKRAAVRAARRDVETALAAMTDEQYARAARLLRDTVGDVPAATSKKNLLAAVREQLDEDYPISRVAARRGKTAPKFGTKTVKPAKAVKPAVVARAAAGGAGRKTAFDLLDDLAASSGEVAHALRTFQQACLHEETSVIQQTALALRDAISKHRGAADLDWKAADRCRRAVATVARSFERQATSAEGKAAAHAFWTALDDLPAGHPLLPVYARLHSWLTPEDLEKLGTAAARLRPMTGVGLTEEALADAAGGRINSVVGRLGEIVGVKGAYRRTFEAELRRAAEFADSAAGRGWRVFVARTPVRALRADGKGFHQFYDDAIMLVDEARGKVALSFTGQFKAGDAASLDVLAQLDSDELRVQLGKLLVDGKVYDIEKGIIPRRSTIVTTTLGVADEQTFLKGGAKAAGSARAAATTDPARLAEAISDREIQFLPMGVDPADLRAFVRFFLEAAGKIPPG